MDPNQNQGQERAEKYMAEDAMEAWKSGEWKGRVMVSKLMPFLKSEHEKTGPVSKAAIAMFIATVSGMPREPRLNIADILDDDGVKKFAEKAWAGQITLIDLADAAKAKGAKLSPEDVDKLIAENQAERQQRSERFEEKRRMRNEKDDLVGPLRCQAAKVHNPHFADMEYQPKSSCVIFEDKNTGELKMVTEGMVGTPKRVGDFLQVMSIDDANIRCRTLMKEADSDEVSVKETLLSEMFAFHCPHCKGEVEKAHRDQQRDLKREDRVYLPWMTYEKASKMVDNTYQAVSRHEATSGTASAAAEAARKNREFGQQYQKRGRWENRR